MVYKVWSAQNEFMGTLPAANDAEAIRRAKLITPAPMVRSELLERKPLVL